MSVVEKNGRSVAQRAAASQTEVAMARADLPFALATMNPIVGGAAASIPGRVA